MPGARHAGVPGAMGQARPGESMLGQLGETQYFMQATASQPCFRAEDLEPVEGLTLPEDRGRGTYPSRWEGRGLCSFQERVWHHRAASENREEADKASGSYTADIPGHQLQARYSIGPERRRWTNGGPGTRSGCRAGSVSWPTWFFYIEGLEKASEGRTVRMGTDWIWHVRKVTGPCHMLRKLLLNESGWKKAGLSPELGQHSLQAHTSACQLLHS
jgi:hypothetical protein